MTTKLSLIANDAVTGVGISNRTITADDIEDKTITKDKIDFEDKLMPIGSIIVWPGFKSIPKGWQICNGNAIPTDSPLYSSIKSTPNLGISRNYNFYHDFNNNTNITNQIIGDGIKLSVMNETSPNDLPAGSFGDDIYRTLPLNYSTHYKHYIIVFDKSYPNNDYQILFFIPSVGYVERSLNGITAGGSNYQVEVDAISNKTANGFNIWFRTTSIGRFNTYIRNFEFAIVPFSKVTPYNFSTRKLENNFIMKVSNK